MFKFSINLILSEIPFVLEVSSVQKLYDWDGLSKSIKNFKAHLKNTIMRLSRRFFVVNGIYLNSFIEIKKQIKFLIKAERARSIFWGSDILNFSWALQSGYSAKLFFAICGKESSSAQTKFSLPVTTRSARENLNTDHFQLKNWKKKCFDAF